MPDYHILDPDSDAQAVLRITQNINQLNISIHDENAKALTSVVLDLHAGKVRLVYNDPEDKAHKIVCLVEDIRPAKTPRQLVILYYNSRIGGFAAESPQAPGVIGHGWSADAAIGNLITSLVATGQPLVISSIKQSSS